MKAIFRILFAMSLSGTLLFSCSEEEPFSTAGPNDEPHILSPVFPDRNDDGSLPVVANINRDANFSMTLTVTPSEYTDVVWYIDGNEVTQGNSIDMALPAGSYNMKVTVTTVEGKSTFREGIVQVNPLDGDPWATEQSFERIIAPGNEAVLYGDNLDKVKSLKIGETVIDDVNFSSDTGTPHITYLVPENVAEGEQRLTLIDAEGNEYGANKVTVSSTSLVTSGADRITSAAAWTMTGINLDKIASFTIGDKTITEFTEQTATEILFTCPELADGEYTLTGAMNDGNAVTFYINKEIVQQATVTVSSEQTLWSGHHYVSWDLPDGDPNKTFSLGKELFSGVTAGAVLSVHYSIEPGDEYHQIQPTSGWWTPLPGTTKTDVSADGILEVVLTQEVLDMIQAEDGFLCTGHGFYVDLITIK